MRSILKSFSLTLLLSFFVSVSPVIAATGTYWAPAPYYVSFGGVSASAACQAFFVPAGWSLVSTSPEPGGGQYCNVMNGSGQLFEGNGPVRQAAGTCPPEAPEVNESGECAEPDPCVATQGQPVSWLSDTGTDGCVDGCTTGGVTACFNIPKIVDGVTTAEYHCSSDYSSTGAFCTGGGDTQTQPLIETCAAGQIAGDFNGSFQCVDNTTGQVVDTSPTVTETAITNTTSTTVDNGDGTTTTTTTITKINADGSTSTTIKTETKNASGQVTSSGTITNSQLKDSDGDGTADGSGEGEGDGEDTESTYSVSACGAAPACEGDAIQCAIATQQHEANCLITGDGTPITTEGLLGSGEATTLAVDPSDQYDISGILDTSSFVAGTCPAPRTISVYGQNMTIDYTELCNLADILGYLVMFTASIISLRIIGGAF